MQDINEILKDQDFLDLPDGEKQKVMVQIDPDFAQLPANEQLMVIGKLGAKPDVKYTEPDPAAPVDPTADMSPGQLAMHNTKMLAGKVGTGLKNLAVGSAEFLGKLDENPLATVLETGQSILSGAKKAITAPIDVAKKTYEGDTDGAAQATSEFITEGIPGLLGAKGAVKGIRAIPEGVKSAADSGLLGKRLEYRQQRPLISMEPEGHLRTALKLDMEPELLKVAGDQLKAGEQLIGKPVKDIDVGREASKAQFQQELMPLRRSIIDPQKDVTVPGSRRRAIAAKIDAIPKDILPDTPEYTRLVESARASVPTDLTIGQLENMNTSLNSSNRGFHQAKLTQALSKLENANGAMDVAMERTSRELMEEGMQTHGLGGYDKLRKVNQRIGALMRLEDAFDTVERQARQQAELPRFRRKSKGEKSTHNESLAQAMRTWKSRPDFIQGGTEWGPTGPRRQLTSGSTIDMGPVPDTSGPQPFVAREGMGMSNSGRPKMITAKAGGPYTMGEVPPTVPPDVPLDKRFPVQKGPFTGKPIAGKQIPLQPTVIKPKTGAASPIFGMRQEVPQTVPKGSVFVSKARNLLGEDVFRYKTPDGDVIEVTGIETQKVGSHSPKPLKPPPKRRVPKKKE